MRWIGIEFHGLDSRKLLKEKKLKRATRLKYKRKNINKDWCFPSGPFSRTKL